MHDNEVQYAFLGSIQKSQVQEKVTADEIAIIGFWKTNNSDSTFECYNSIKVPNPMKRIVNTSQRRDCPVSIKQFLYPCDRGIFFFYKEPNN